MAKEKIPKSGQILVPVIGASKSRDTLKRIDLQEDENTKEVGATLVAKRKTLAEKKLDLLSKCTEANANRKAPLPNESGANESLRRGKVVTVG